MVQRESDASQASQVVDSFRKAVIDRFQVIVDGQVCDYREYLSKPETKRSNDEANVVDQRFTLYTLEWLGFDSTNWIYNQPQAGQKANRPDYLVKGTVGIAFIWEDKNSTLELKEEQLAQMRRYAIGTAGYAVWCNIRRILALRFSPNDALRYDILTDVAVDELFNTKASPPDNEEKQATNLALFQLLFGKVRFTQFIELADSIAVDEETFEHQATSFAKAEAVQTFITGSRESLEHLRLAALTQIRDAIDRRHKIKQDEASLLQEWANARDEFINSITFSVKGLDAISKPVLEAIERLTPRLGEVDPHEIRRVGEVVEQVGTVGIGRVSASLRTRFEKWLERALHINSALLSLRLSADEPFRIAEAYTIWSERQSDQQDVEPRVFAEQVAYVFFVRLLLVRVLEDKHILSPRLASDGGFLEWSKYVKRHFNELDGVGILNQNYSDILSRKAGYYYLHFFQQAVFDWFNPDDFLFVETLEFLCRYNFKQVTSDIIGFTYEEYIDRNARNRKGHFLTRQDVVEYMLDILEYSGPQIVERSILDPACGSGSFLVHAARRYRHALMMQLCNVYAMTPEQIAVNSERRYELARRYLDDLTHFFYGMELNPFACYLAEMNLLIQGLDDLVVLQQAGHTQPIERFHICNTDSLDLPREVLDSTYMAGASQEILVPDRLSDRLTDDAYHIKAKLDDRLKGFFYIISNPPYVNSRQEKMDVNRFRNAEFYRIMLSGDTNLYLLFLRLGMYYLADYGQMIYIVPLTIFGDRSASVARKLLKTPPFSPDLVTRFYRGDILFPGIDQAVGIIRIRHTLSNETIMVSGGITIQDARANPFRTKSADIVDAVPQNGVWQGNWLVVNSQLSLDIWEHVKRVSVDFSRHLGQLLDACFDIKQGDINATVLNPLRIGTHAGNFSVGDVAIYKGEDIKPYAPLPSFSSDWARTLSNQTDVVSREVIRASQVLGQLKQMNGKEVGVVLRQVARLNTRERLIASWFERTSSQPLAFTNELWRMLLKANASEQEAKALFALLSSKVVTYLINLFSTNNHVSKDELDRVPIPDPCALPMSLLASLADQLLTERANLENAFVTKYHAKLPEFETSKVYVPPSAVLADTPRIPKLAMLGLVGRGMVRNNGPANWRIKALRAKNYIVCIKDSNVSNAEAFAEVLALFLNEPDRENDTWSEAQHWQLPDPIAAIAWLDQYRTVSQQVQERWGRFVTLLQQLDDAVADWYGFDSTMRSAIAQGLPWARRRRGE